MITDGCFMPNGWSYVLPEIHVRKLESFFRHKVLTLLLREMKDPQGAGRKAPLSEKLRFQRSQSGQNQKPGPSGGKPGRVYPPFPIFFGENDLPAADQNGTLSL
jgi:hypothetical protein